MNVVTHANNQTKYMLGLAFAGLVPLRSHAPKMCRMTQLTYNRMAGGLVCAALMSLTILLFSQEAGTGPKETVLLMASGTVEVAPTGGSNFAAAHAKQVLHVGDQIRT